MSIYDTLRYHCYMEGIRHLVDYEAPGYASYKAATFQSPQGNFMLVYKEGTEEFSVFSHNAALEQFIRSLKPIQDRKVPT